METINWIAGVATYLVKSNLFYGVIFLVYFSFLYRWFFSWKIKVQTAFYGALTFVVTLLIGKNLFLVYFNYVRANLVRNYGDYYTFIVGMMWIFFVMCFFFYGACVCHVYHNTEGVDPADRISRYIQRLYRQIVVNFKLSFKKITSIICKK